MKIESLDAVGSTVRQFFNRFLMNVEENMIVKEDGAKV
jgi:hypothetical protein